MVAHRAEIDDQIGGEGEDPFEIGLSALAGQGAELGQIGIGAGEEITFVRPIGPRPAEHPFRRHDVKQDRCRRAGGNDGVDPGRQIHGSPGAVGDALRRPGNAGRRDQKKAENGHQDTHHGLVPSSAILPTGSNPYAARRVWISSERSASASSCASATSGLKVRA